MQVKKQTDIFKREEDGSITSTSPIVINKIKITNNDILNDDVSIFSGGSNTGPVDMQDLIREMYSGRSNHKEAVAKYPTQMRESYMEAFHRNFAIEDPVNHGSLPSIPLNEGIFDCLSPHVFVRPSDMLFSKKLGDPLTLAIRIFDYSQPEYEYNPIVGVMDQTGNYERLGDAGDVGYVIALFGIHFMERNFRQYPHEEIYVDGEFYRKYYVAADNIIAGTQHYLDIQTKTVVPFLNVSDVSILDNDETIKCVPIYERDSQEEAFLTIAFSGVVSPDEENIHTDRAETITGHFSLRVLN